jgi:hypothetical protein
MECAIPAKQAETTVPNLTDRGQAQRAQNVCIPELEELVLLSFHNFHFSISSSRTTVVNNKQEPAASCQQLKTRIQILGKQDS